MEVAEMIMLWWMSDMIRLDKIRSIGVVSIAGKMRKNGHVERRGK